MYEFIQSPAKNGNKVTYSDKRRAKINIICILMRYYYTRTVCRDTNFKQNWIYNLTILLNIYPSKLNIRESQIYAQMYSY